MDELLDTNKCTFMNEEDGSNYDKKDKEKPKLYNYKLLVDPFLKGNNSKKIYRFDGHVPDDPTGSCVILKDPRRQFTHFLFSKKIADLLIPKFKLDKNYVGIPPSIELTITNLNDNIKEKFLEDLCLKFGAIDELKIYYHPISKKHLTIGRVIFQQPKFAKLCIEKLNKVSVMGKALNVFLDPLGKHCSKIVDSIINSNNAHPFDVNLYLSENVYFVGDHIPDNLKSFIPLILPKSINHNLSNSLPSMPKYDPRLKNEHNIINNSLNISKESPPDINFDSTQSALNSLFKNNNSQNLNDINQNVNKFIITDSNDSKDSSNFLDLNHNSFNDISDKDQYAKDFNMEMPFKPYEQVISKVINPEIDIYVQDPLTTQIEIIDETQGKDSFKYAKEEKFNVEINQFNEEKDVNHLSNSNRHNEKYTSHNKLWKKHDYNHNHNNNTHKYSSYIKREKFDKGKKNNTYEKSSYSKPSDKFRYKNEFYHNKHRPPEREYGYKTNKEKYNHNYNSFSSKSRDNRKVIISNSYRGTHHHKRDRDYDQHKNSFRSHSDSSKKSSLHSFKDSNLLGHHRHVIKNRSKPYKENLIKKEPSQDNYDPGEDICSQIGPMTDDAIKTFLAKSENINHSFDSISTNKMDNIVQSIKIEFDDGTEACDKMSLSPLSSYKEEESDGGDSTNKDRIIKRERLLSDKEKSHNLANSSLPHNANDASTNGNLNINNPDNKFSPYFAGVLAPHLLHYHHQGYQNYPSHFHIPLDTFSGQHNLSTNEVSNLNSGTPSFLLSHMLPPPPPLPSYLYPTMLPPPPFPPRFDPSLNSGNIDNSTFYRGFPPQIPAPVSQPQYTFTTLMKKISPYYQGIIMKVISKLFEELNIVINKDIHKMLVQKSAFTFYDKWWQDSENIYQNRKNDLVNNTAFPLPPSSDPFAISSSNLPPNHISEYNSTSNSTSRDQQASYMTGRFNAFKTGVDTTQLLLNSLFEPSFSTTQSTTFKPYENSSFSLGIRASMPKMPSFRKIKKPQPQPSQTPTKNKKFESLKDKDGTVNKANKKASLDYQPATDNKANIKTKKKGDQIIQESPKNASPLDGIIKDVLDDKEIDRDKEEKIQDLEREDDIDSVLSDSSYLSSHLDDMGEVAERPDSETEIPSSSIDDSEIEEENGTLKKNSHKIKFKERVSISENSCSLDKSYLSDNETKDSTRQIPTTTKKQKGIKQFLVDENANHAFNDITRAVSIKANYDATKEDLKTTASIKEIIKSKVAKPEKVKSSIGGLTKPVTDTTSFTAIDESTNEFVDITDNEKKLKRKKSSDPKYKESSRKAKLKNKENVLADRTNNKGVERVNQHVYQNKKPQKPLVEKLLLSEHCYSLPPAVPIKQNTTSTKERPPKIYTAPKSAIITYQARDAIEEMKLLYDMWNPGIDLEDIAYVRKSYERYLAHHRANNSTFILNANNKTGELVWLEYTHWVPHMATHSYEPPTKKKRKKEKSRGILSNDSLQSLTSTKSGSARTEGYYKITSEQKTALYSLTNEKRADTPFKKLNNNQTHLNDTSSSSNLNNAKNITGITNNQRNLLHHLNTTTSRQVRSEFRRQVWSKSQELGDLIKFNQLKARKKQLAFKKSRIHDWGLYARENIAASDEMIIEYVGEIVRQSIADKREKLLYSNCSSYLFRVDSETIIDATKCGNLARFINHSCNPNCYAKIITVGQVKKIVIYSKQPIKIGEEITYDYKFPIEDEKIPCLCGAYNCRGTLN
ncbi:unnamed protein product [Gordionus sp. m RMFG-2023]|uniref:uncharacterized protein LOC135923520 isoform X2 n=1 Tax=Gordionus sp. m RMFG-2023 TaxID=3053472 RepID=UPI0030DF1BC5